MKKLLTICLLIATAFSAKAQEMNFEETVKYINDKIECCYQYKPMTFTLTRSGQISFNNKTVNLFDLVSTKQPDIIAKDVLMEDKGIWIWASYGYYQIYFQVSEKKEERFLMFSSQVETERVYKALLHLRSLCTKEKDPFDK